MKLSRLSTSFRSPALICSQWRQAEDLFNKGKEETVVAYFSLHCDFHKVLMCKLKKSTQDTRPRQGSAAAGAGCGGRGGVPDPQEAAGGRGAEVLRGGGQPQ